MDLSSSQLTLLFTMDKTISNFLKEGPEHHTAKSHKTAAVNYHKFLDAQSKCRTQDRLKFSRPQLKALRDLNPREPTHPVWFSPMTKFFLTSNTIYGRFHRFGQFFAPNSSQKKNQSIWKDIFLFFSDIWVFFLLSAKRPQKKPRYHKKKKISLSPQRFSLLYGIKRGYYKQNGLIANIILKS